MYEPVICAVKRLHQYAADGDMEHVAVLAVSDHPICGEYLAAFSDVLCLQFSDVVNSSHPSAITNDIAHRITAGIKALSAGLDTLFVCCDSGESRSAAMAAAILRSDGAVEDPIWRNPHYHPNP